MNGPGHWNCVTTVQSMIILQFNMHQEIVYLRWGTVTDGQKKVSDHLHHSGRGEHTSSEVGSQNQDGSFNGTTSIVLILPAYLRNALLGCRKIIGLARGAKCQL